MIYVYSVYGILVFTLWYSRPCLYYHYQNADLGDDLRTQHNKGVNGCVLKVFMGNPSQTYRASPAMWDHTVLPATQHR